MAVTATPVFGTATTVTITLGGGTPLASSTADPPVGRESAVIDCATIDSDDIVIGGKVTVGTTPASGKSIFIFFAPSYDGTSYAGGAAGAGDAGLTPTNVEQMFLAATAVTKSTTSNVTFTWAAEVRAVCGFMPSKLVVFITHNTTAALNATAGNHELKYRGMNYESA
jgi:hypothetical protein